MGQFEYIFEGLCKLLRIVVSIFICSVFPMLLLL